MGYATEPCADHIVRCVDSALNQTVTDLEVCICDDGSTDETLGVLNRHYGSHPRVRIMSKANGGIGSASNAAVRMARGYYIGQLDSDDYLEPDAVELCLKEFFSNRALACAYTTNRNVNPDGSLIANGYNWPEYSREKLMTAMILHHFRMFTARAWNLTSGFDEKIANAVDYDMYLKLSEVGHIRHVNKIAYNRVLHGENTSIKKLGIQKKNHFLVVNASMDRLGVQGVRYLPVNDQDDICRKYQFINTLSGHDKKAQSICQSMVNFKDSQEASKKIEGVSNKIITYWEQAGETPPPPYVLLSIASMKAALGEKFLLLTNGNAPSIIDNAYLDKEWKFIKKNRSLSDRVASIVAKSDYIRMQYIYEHGGAWIDADSIVVGDIASALNIKDDKLHWHTEQLFAAQKGNELIGSVCKKMLCDEYQTWGNPGGIKDGLQDDNYTKIPFKFVDPGYSPQYNFKTASVVLRDDVSVTDFLVNKEAKIIKLYNTDLSANGKTPSSIAEFLKSGTLLAKIFLHINPSIDYWISLTNDIKCEIERNGCVKSE